MEGKRRYYQISVCANKEQYDNIKAKAKEYGMSASALLLKACEAYVRTFEEDVGESDAVVVNYAAWLSIDRTLYECERMLRECAQWIVGIERVLRAGVDALTLSQADVERVVAVLRQCGLDIEESGRTIREAYGALDRIAACVLIEDPYLGPLAETLALRREGDGGA